MVKFTLKGISNLTESPAYFQQVNGIYRKDGALAVLTNPEIIQVGDELSYTFPSDTFIDQEGDSLQYTAMLTSGNGLLPSFLSFNPITRTLSGEADAASAGKYVILFQADGGYGGVANSSVIQVHVNTQPSALSTAWQTTALPVSQQFSTKLPIGFMQDADGDILRYSLVRTNAEHLVPAWVSLDNTTLYGTPLGNDHQAVTIQLKGEDGFGGEVYRLVSIRIPNSAPMVKRALGVVTAYAGELKTYIVPRDTVIDADGDELAYSASRFDRLSGVGGLPLPEWAVHLPSINIFNLVPKSGDQGNYTVALIATDTQGASIQTRFNVYVPNRAPVLTTAYADENLEAFKRLSYSVAGHFTDADGDVLSYEVSKPVWVEYDEGTKTLKGLPPQIVRSYDIAISLRTTQNCYLPT